MSVVTYVGSCCHINALTCIPVSNMRVQDYGICIMKLAHICVILFIRFLCCSSHLEARFDIIRVCSKSHCRHHQQEMVITVTWRLQTPSGKDGICLFQMISCLSVITGLYLRRSIQSIFSFLTNCFYTSYTLLQLFCFCLGLS